MIFISFDLVLAQFLLSFGCVIYLTTFFKIFSFFTDYEEVNTRDCVTMITVMPGTSRSTLSSSNGTMDLATTTSTRESETSSSEGGSFIIDSAAFYENLNFHYQRNLRTNLSPAASKFGYSQKEVWNWLYTDHDINQNCNSKKVPNNKAVEVKFSLSEFVDSYKRLSGLNLEGFPEFVNKTLEAILSTSVLISNNNNSTSTTGRKTTHCCTNHHEKILVPSLKRSETSQKTYVRLSMMKQEQQQQKGAFSCYQTLLDINKYHDAGIHYFLFFLLCIADWNPYLLVSFFVKNN